jgi:hypothetical protein
MMNKPIVLFVNTAMQLRSQRPLHMQGVAGHPGVQGGGQEKNYWKKWRAKKEERHKESLEVVGRFNRVQVLHKSYL